MKTIVVNYITCKLKAGRKRRKEEYRLLYLPSQLLRNISGAACNGERGGRERKRKRKRER